MSSDIPRIVISATHSGAGKSTITMGLLMALKKRGLDPQSFKVGPDYIDPMHHTMVLGRECRNLDTWMFGDEIERLFVQGSKGSGISVVEGVMGLYDGKDGVNEEGSTSHLSKMIKAPVILIIDARSMARSAGAIALGFKEYDKATNIAGVIFNRVGSENHLKILRDSLRGIPCIGGVFRNECMAIESRYMGLETDLDMQRYEKIAEHIENCVDIDMLVKIASAAPPIKKEFKEVPTEKKRVRIGVAKDKAFNFYYIHNMESLVKAGAELVPFSPITDDLPVVDGLLFGGGYPELFTEGLEKNKKIRKAIKKAADDGLPIYAESGGMMYLTKGISDVEGKRKEMCGIFDAESKMHDKLQSLGYVEMTSNTDSVICEKGWTVRGHAFHYSSLTTSAKERYAFDLAKGKGIENGKDGMTSDNALGLFSHIHFASNPKVPKRFVDSCADFSRS
ncbi:MAG: hydrogenobyrinic acid a,c-diamide synthase (glutamine-hydrolyzing) [Methanomassiliicoccaceae archaeon]|nr:hydrogenobyrinic acid a,c-diamide synthase (glutamine-hydrolyzing) [Methanomassiliicoccaceae archaeon]MCL2317949.1 hydrogenobyrinic acid a,c-diamide synthase (glutamine-hydrolyzing) [Methanomassiliicoccaceae archaeon]